MSSEEKRTSISRDHMACPLCQRLLIGLLDGQLEAADRLRLVELLRNDPAARTHYLRYMLTDAMLRLEHGTPIEVDPVSGQARREREVGSRGVGTLVRAVELPSNCATIRQSYNRQSTIVCPAHHSGFVPHRRTLPSSLSTRRSAAFCFRT